VPRPETFTDLIVRSVFSSPSAGITGLLFSPLAAASYLYQAAVALRQRGYQRAVFSSRKLPVPVISVGNLTVGGTGKTPTTLFLARALHAQGMKVAVLSRGYKGSASATVNVVSDGSQVILRPEQSGDEPFLLAQHLPGIPVLTGKDRGRAGAYAIDRFSADMLILDDGFQHLSLHREVDIVCLDGQRPFGNGWMLPRGPLREGPWALSRAHLALITEAPLGAKQNRSELASQVHIYHPSLPLFYGYYVPDTLITLSGQKTCAPADLEGKRVIALAGVARPRSFLRLLLLLGAEVVETVFYSDHYQYRCEDLTWRSKNALVVTTEKDAVKLRALGVSEPEIWVLPVRLQVEQESRFLECLKKWLPSRR